MAQYYIRDAFEDVIITGQILNDILKIFIVSDLYSTKYGVNARIQVYNWTSFKPLHEIMVIRTLVSLCYNWRNTVITAAITVIQFNLSYEWPL